MLIDKIWHIRVLPLKYMGSPDTLEQPYTSTRAEQLRKMLNL